MRKQKISEEGSPDYMYVLLTKYRPDTKLNENEGPKYPDIDVQLTGNDGNAYAIMGAVGQALRRAGVSKEEIDQYSKESMSGDYDNLLRTAMKWVNVS